MVLNNHLTANNIGERVDIASTTSQNKYICPSDGYVSISANTSNRGGLIRIQGANDAPAVGMPFEPPVNGYATIFVKKGMKVWNDDSGFATRGVGFFPLT